MMRHTLFAAVLLAGTACSAQQRNDFPQAKGMTDEGPMRGGATAGGGPQGPVVPGSERPVPKDSPLEPDIHNVAATAGHANIAPTPPPFNVATIGRFDAPFAMAFLPDGSLLVTEKAGALKLRLAGGATVSTAGVPAVAQGGQGGLLDVAVSPDYAASHAIYFSYAEPRPNGGSSLALVRATLVTAGDRAAPSLRNVEVIWRAGSDGPGGQFGARIAFAPDGKSLFLTSGERQRFSPAQDPDQLLGKIVHLTLDGKPAPGNPFTREGGYRAEIYSSGHRNPYGLLFTPDGRLWEEEMGPRGGDELNLIQPGRNYGWPIVSNGDNYSGQPIPDHPSRPDLEAPKLWWNPSISPSGMILYTGTMFPQLRGSLLIGALSAKGVAHVTLDGARATPADFWDMGTRIRDVAQAPDGSIWLLEDGEQARLLRLTPQRP